MSGLGSTSEDDQGGTSRTKEGKEEMAVLGRRERGRHMRLNRVGPSSPKRVKLEQTLEEECA